MLYNTINLAQAVAMLLSIYMRPTMFCAHLFDLDVNEVLQICLKCLIRVEWDAYFFTFSLIPFTFSLRYMNYSTMHVWIHAYIDR